MTKQVQEWIENEIVDFTNYIEELRKIYRNKEIDFVTRSNAVPASYLDLVRGAYGSEKEKEIIEKMVNSHYNKLQDKVKKVIGEIQEIEEITETLYKFKGEDKNCVVEIIQAGGYNIQRRHTRWLVKK